MLSLAMDIQGRGLMAGRHVGLEMEGEVRGEHTDLGIPSVRWEWEPQETTLTYAPLDSLLPIFIGHSSSLEHFYDNQGGNVYNVFELPRSQAFGQHKELL